MGGYGSWDLAERMPERFAALVPICGGGDEAQADRLVGLPIWAWHGDADQAVPVERSRRMIAAIEKAGGKPKYTELPGVGHDSWTPAYTGAGQRAALAVRAGRKPRRRRSDAASAGGRTARLPNAAGVDRCARRPV